MVNTSTFILILFTACMLFVFGILFIEVVAGYILQGISMSAVAKRRGIDKPWLAWVPVANTWMLGCISDQYQLLVNGKDRNYRTRLLKLKIPYAIISSALWICLAAYMGIALHLLIAQEGGFVSEEMVILSVLGIYGLAMLLELLNAGNMVLGVFCAIFQYKCLYDYYRSCDPKTTLPFFIVSFFSSIPMGIFMLLDRNKDLGMPTGTEEV